LDLNFELLVVLIGVEEVSVVLVIEFGKVLRNEIHAIVKGVVADFEIFDLVEK
jgi:hypothetical protein